MKREPLPAPSARSWDEFELADKGTIFLDEIGELPLELQPKLLRVLQDREFERPGGIHTLQVDVRIIAATNRDLRQDIADKRFREDLFYRLNVFPVELPALNERRGDIPILVQHFVRKHSTRIGKHIDIIPYETMKILQNWSWPGNVRKLENMIERMVIMSKGQVLAAPPVELQAAQDPANGSLTEIEREHIIRVLRETNGVLSEPKERQAGSALRGPRCSPCSSASIFNYRIIGTEEMKPTESREQHPFERIISSDDCISSVLRANGRGVGRSPCDC